MAGYRTVYDRFKATPPEGFNAGIVRTWIALQLLAILDNRNHGNADIVDAMEINYEFTKRLHDRLGPQLQRLVCARERRSSGRSRPISGPPTRLSGRCASGRTST